MQWGQQKGCNFADGIFKCILDNKIFGFDYTEFLFDPTYNRSVAPLLTWFNFNSSMDK